jgi:O-acetyl-ADP-ribose deacetylase (regulator of RNase III)
MAKAPKVMVQHTIGLCNVALTYGQIIHEDVDAIVLVANTKLKLCAVTAKAMRQLGGPSVSEELNKILVREGGRLGFGQVVYTRAGDVTNILYRLVGLRFHILCCASQL